MELTNTASAFSGLVDLASERNGGKALIASDEFFAGKENLLRDGRGIFIPDKFTDNGKWMDGWESRRKRTPGNDWCIIKLGLHGIIRGVDIDTNHFLGNHPPYASVDACLMNDDVSPEAISSENISWVEVIGKSPLKAGSQNLYSAINQIKCSHVRLNIFPDGGVARFRVYCSPVPQWESAAEGGLFDIAALINGGKVLACNDMFFGSMDNLIAPGKSRNMGEGWETKRKRVPGFDWVIVRLARAGKPERIIVDTNLFKGNFPDSCMIEGCYAPDADDNEIAYLSEGWKELLPKSKLRADCEHLFEKEIRDIGKITHVRLNIFPDGGISRLKVFSQIKNV